jgi:RNA-binding protein YhbY
MTKAKRYSEAFKWEAIFRAGKEGITDKTVRDLHESLSVLHDINVELAEISDRGTGTPFRLQHECITGHGNTLGKSKHLIP